MANLPNKKLPKDFNYNTYRKLNPGLQELTDLELKTHYLTIGVKESLQYKIVLPEDFNCNLYRRLNKDINKLTDEELEEHYITIGKIENRKYSNKLPICITNVKPDAALVRGLKWLVERDATKIYFNTHVNDLKCNALNKRVQCIFNGNICSVQKTFLVSKNNNSDVQLFHYSKDYIFIADVTNYSIEAIYELKTKILYISKPELKQTYIDCVEIFVNLTHKHSEVFTQHLNNKTPVKFCTFLGVKQIMHHYINEMSGIWNLFSDLKLTTIFSYFEYYGKHEDVLAPKLKNTDIQRNVNTEDLFLETCKNNLFFVKQCDTYVPVELNERVLSLHKSDKKPLVLSRYNKCILFTVRASHRKLKNQIGFICTCIKQLEKKYPNSIFLIDGMSKLHTTGYTEESSLVVAEKEIFKQISERLNGVRVHSLIFTDIKTFINHAMYVDYYVSHIGTCQHKLGYFSKATGVVHGGGECKHSETDASGWYWSAHFGNVCRKIDNYCFEYDNVQNYNSDYVARLDICAQWAKSVTI